LRIVERREREREGERGRERKREEEVVIEPVVSSMELHGPIRRKAMLMPSTARSSI
jgi:hypothetical protein